MPLELGVEQEETDTGKKQGPPRSCQSSTRFPMDRAIEEFSFEVSGDGESGGETSEVRTVSKFMKRPRTLNEKILVALAFEFVPKSGGRIEIRI